MRSLPRKYLDVKLGVCILRARCSKSVETDPLPGFPVNLQTVAESYP